MRSLLLEVALVVVLALIQQSMGAPVWASWAVAWIYARLALSRYDRRLGGTVGEE